MATISVVCAESKAEENLDAFGQSVRDSAATVERALGWAAA